MQSLQVAIVAAAESQSAAPAPEKAAPAEHSEGEPAHWFG